MFVRVRFDTPKIMKRSILAFTLLGWSFFDFQLKVALIEK
jgi:hypothetical protein